VTEPNPEFLVCAVCDRTILRGERATDYVNGDGETVQVCELCKGRAEASGWVPAAFSATVSRQAPERRRARVGNALREVLAWRAEAAAGSQPAPAPEPEPEPEEPAAEPDPEPDEVRTPLEVFNSTGEPRKIAGLMRSLGEPRVSVREPDASTALIVVAWDLSWYRWRVRGEQVSELAKGNEISELPVEEREWNASAAEDGTLSLD
jgi:hypothetical protein